MKIWFIQGLAVLLPYAGWPEWSFLHGSFTLIILQVLREGWPGLQKLGLLAPRRAWILLLLALPVGVILAGIWQRHRAALLGIDTWPQTEFYWQVQPFCQSLNEELILGFVALIWGQKIGLKSLPNALLLAVFFAGLHAFLYSFLNKNSSPLGLDVLLGLVLFGICRYALILLNRHILGAFFLHASWNFSFVGNFWFRLDEQGEQRQIHEGDMFTVMLSDEILLGILSAGAVVCLISLWWNTRERQLCIS